MKVLIRPFLLSFLILGAGAPLNVDASSFYVGYSCTNKEASCTNAGCVSARIVLEFRFRDTKTGKIQKELLSQNGLSYDGT